MPGDYAPFLLLVGVIVVVGVVIGGWTRERKRREALFAWCAQHGWTYAGVDESLTGRWTGTPFGTGERRRAENVMHGMLGSRRALAFDYSYQTSTTDSKGNRSTTTHRFAVVFPSNAVASWFGFGKAEYFEVDDPTVRAAPAVDFG